MNNLNTAQLAAVTSGHPRILCLAGAGTGKTHTMVSRAARLIEEGVDPRNILILTFTNAAAREMKERLVTMVGKPGEEVWASTFHSWAVKEIRRHGRILGYDYTFSIYDQEDAESIVQAIIDELQYKVKAKDVMTAMAQNTTYGTHLTGDIDKVVREYRFRCKRQNAIDLDSLIPTLQLLLNRDTIAQIMRNQYKYIFVDEFQDTDMRQMILLETINPDNLFVVGDDFQSIYGFRGSDVNIIMGLAKDPRWEVIKLEENYRSTIEIVESANRLIKHNNQTEKTLKAHRNGQQVALIEKITPEEELDWIAGKCIRMELDGLYKTAVLARTNKQVDTIAKRLAERDVPYIIKQQTPDVLQTMEAKKMFAYMQAVINPQDDEAIRQVINWPEQRLTKRELLEVEMWQLENNSSLFTALQATGKAPSLVDLLWEMHNLPLIECFTAARLYETMLEKTEIIPWFHATGLDNRTQRMWDIYSAIVEWEATQEDKSAMAWLEHYKMRLIEGIPGKEEETDAVQLMTIHKAKGLEFDNVIVAGMNQKSFPLGKGDLQEERRLCYVAITRAKNKLYLTRSLMRTVWGNHQEEAEPSVFLEEM